MRRSHKQASLIAVIVLTAVLTPVVPASASTEEIAVINQAWYWEPQTNENFDTPAGSIAVDLNNPFCPTVPSGGGATLAEQACAPGRVPVEVQNGDYETPDKISAVGFDLTVIPVGSTISDFTVTFLEDKAGCEQQDPDDPQSARCRNTDPINPEGKELKACVVNEIFGDGEARPYDEVPRHTCSPDDPVAQRKEITVKTDAGVDEIWYTWTFDLTEYAAEWTKAFSVSTAIMLYPVQPKDDDDDAGTAPDESWRIVLAGPKGQAGKQPGIETKLSYKAPKTPATPPPTSGSTGSTGSTFTGSTGSTGSTGFTGTTGDTGFTTGSTGTTGTTGGTGTGEEEAPTVAGDAPASAEAPAIESLPGYVWLALLAGLVGMSLVRSVVVERTVGHRPDGVIAQIHQMNADRRGEGTPAALATASGPLSLGLTSVGRFFGKIGSSTAALAGKLPFNRKG